MSEREVLFQDEEVSVWGESEVGELVTELVVSVSSIIFTSNTANFLGVRFRRNIERFTVLPTK